MTRDIEFRLVGHDSDDGELLAADAINIIRSFKLTLTVLNRSRAASVRPRPDRSATARVSR